MAYGCHEFIETPAQRLVREHKLTGAQSPEQRVTRQLREEQLGAVIVKMWRAGVMTQEEFNRANVHVCCGDFKRASEIILSCEGRAYQLPLGSITDEAARNHHMARARAQKH